LMRRGYAGATRWGHILSSLELVLLGFTVAAATGTPLGLLMGRSRVAHAYLNSIFQLIRPIAPIAWIPLTILWFGLGTPAKVFVVWLAAFAPIVINTITGARNIDPVLIAAAKVHGASRRHILFDIVIPGSMPTIFTGLRVSLQACWMVLVASELVGSFTGLGHIMIIATRDLNPGMIFIAMACVSILGVLSNLALAQVEHWVIPWRR
jgi:taurine transport system permease protein